MYKSGYVGLANHFAAESETWHELIYLDMIVVVCLRYDHVPHHGCRKTRSRTILLRPMEPKMCMYRRQQDQGSDLAMSFLDWQPQFKSQRRNEGYDLSTSLAL